MTATVTMIPRLDERRFTEGVCALKVARDVDKARALRVSSQQLIDRYMRRAGEIRAAGGSAAKAASSLFRRLDGPGAAP